MTPFHEDFHHPLAGNKLPPGGLRYRNFVTRLNQLSKILGSQPVITPEIKVRLWRDAEIWANRGVDLSAGLAAEAAPELSMDTIDHSGSVENDLTLRYRAFMNLMVLYWESTKEDEDEDVPELSQYIRERLGQVARFLAELGVDLSDAPDIDEGETG